MPGHPRQHDRIYHAKLKLQNNLSFIVLIHVLFVLFVLLRQQKVIR